MAEQLKNFSKSANRALEVLAHLAEVDAPTRASDVADALGMARSSADQLLKTMVAGGYLVLSPQDKTYLPSLRLVKFGRWLVQRYPEEPKLRDIVEEVHERTGEIVTVTMQNDCYMQIVQVARAGDEDPLLNIGERVPVLGSAIGGAALTRRTRNEIRKLAQRARNQRAVLEEPAAIKDLINQISLYRMVGYSARSTRRSGLARRADDYWSIAVTMPSAEPRINVVLGLCGTVASVRPRENQIVGVMRDAIRRHLAG